MVEDAEEEENPLEDYTLAGVCKVKGGWFVVLINKKDRNERLRLRPGKSTDQGFEVVNVEQGSKRLETKVEIKTRGGKTGWVEYDEKLIAVKKAVPKAPAGGKPGAKNPPVPQRGGPQRPGASTPPVPGKTGNNNTAGRGSRVRRVPTPPTR